MQDWEVENSRRVHENRLFSVREDSARSPRTGATHRFLVMEMTEWVNVVPITATGRVLLVRQFRHGLRVPGLEIPGGVVDPQDASLEAAARRELQEETGGVAGRMEYLGKVAPNPAIQDNWCHSFLALDVERGAAQNLDAGEDIAVEEVDVRDLSELITCGEIHHGLIVAALYLFELYRRRHPDLLDTRHER